MEFVRMLDGRNPAAMRDLLADEFEFEMIARMQGNMAIRGKQVFVDSARMFAEQMFPNGISFRLVSAIAEGPEVALQVESDTIAHNGKPYSNRYHYYFRFAGDKIAQVRDYCDTDYVRNILLS
jgi:ketosteroid isomerase-like protein